jgi:hypothetical protein
MTRGADTHTNLDKMKATATAGPSLRRNVSLLEFLSDRSVAVNPRLPGIVPYVTTYTVAAAITSGS